MPIASYPHAPINIAHPEPTGACDKCGFIYYLSKLTEQQKWAGPSLIKTGVLACPRCLDVPQQNGQRTIIIGPDPKPLKRPRIPFWQQQMAPSVAPQFILDDIVINPGGSGDFSAEFSADDFSVS